MNPAAVCEFHSETLRMIVLKGNACFDDDHLVSLFDLLRGFADQDLILEIEGVDDLSQLAFAALVTFGQERERAKKKLVLCHTGLKITSLIDRFGLSPHFTLANTVSDAIEAFR